MQPETSRRFRMWQLAAQRSDLPTQPPETPSAGQGEWKRQQAVFACCLQAAPVNLTPPRLWAH
eukprot:2634198-Amphidinium_carterae.1